jgi:hypothetical protein
VQKLKKTLNGDSHVAVAFGNRLSSFHLTLLSRNTRNCFSFKMHHSDQNGKLAVAPECDTCRKFVSVHLNGLDYSDFVYSGSMKQPTYCARTMTLV